MTGEEAPRAESVGAFETGLVGDGLVPSRLQFKTGLVGGRPLAESIGAFKTGGDKPRPYGGTARWLNGGFDSK